MFFLMLVTCLCCIQNLHAGIKGRNQYIEVMAKEVCDVLSEVLGGFKYMQTGVYSQYHYYLGQ